MLRQRVLLERKRRRRKQIDEQAWSPVAPVDHRHGSPVRRMKRFASDVVFRAARFWVFFVLWVERFSLKCLQAVFSPRSNKYSPGHS